MSKQSKIEKTHARLAKERDARKATDPTCDMGGVIELMKRAATDLDAVPDDHEWDAGALDRLESIRHEAIRLRLATEAIFDAISGTSSRL